MRRLTVVAALAVAVVAAAIARATFTTSKTTPQTLQAVADFLPPRAGASNAVGPNNAVGVITPGQAYRVYASVADQGNPPSGVQTVTGDLRAIGGGASVPLTAGTYTVGGTAYNYASASLTAASPLAGTLSYSLTMTDNLSQAATQSFSASVAAVACAASGLTASNGATSLARTVDMGDKITYTFTAPIDLNSVLSGWTSGTRTVTVVLESRPEGDTIVIRTADNSRDLYIGTINTGGDFAGTGQWLFTSTMSYVSASNQIQVLLGARTPTTGSPPTINVQSQFKWTPATGLLDSAGKQCSTATFTQPTAVYNF
jgi:hypothetical protein